MNDALLITQKTGDTLYYQFQKKGIFFVPLIFEIRVSSSIFSYAILLVIKLIKG